MLDFARTLRERSTDAESFFWQLLRDRRIAGLKFRRQHVLSPYVLDFYCDQLRFAIELDGGQHNEPSSVARDSRRDAFLASRGIDVFRIWNHDALARTGDVLVQLNHRITARRETLAAENLLLPAGEGAGRRMRAPRSVAASRRGHGVAPSSALRAPSPAGRRKLALPHAPGHPAAWDRALALHTLHALSRSEAEPALLALLDAARVRGVCASVDDDCVTLGRGSGQHSWPRSAPPSPDAVAWHALHGIPTALVTGSNGKTTTVRLLAALGRAHGWRVGSSSTEGLVVDGEVLRGGDYSGPVGARTVLRETRVDAAVLETARGGMLRRGLAVDAADVAVITNVSADHFGEYGVFDIARLAQVKFTVARAVAEHGLLVLNADDAALRQCATAHAGRIGWFGLDIESPALFAARAAGQPVCGVRGGRLLLQRDGTAHDLGAVAAMPLSVDGRARYNIANLAAAALAASEIGIAASTVAQVFAHFGEDNADNRGRLERWSVDGVAVWLDYAHNPDGLAALLDVARGGAARGRLGLLLGQAGNRRDEDLRDLAATAARWAPARVVLKDIVGYERGRAEGAVAAVLRDALLACGMPAGAIAYCGDEVEAVRELLAWAQPGDTLVLPVHGVAARRAVIELLDGRAR
nr:DUF559 domain-containing protein [Chiayiivirga flava]